MLKREALVLQKPVSNKIPSYVLIFIIIHKAFFQKFPMSIACIFFPIPHNNIALVTLSPQHLTEYTPSVLGIFNSVYLCLNYIMFM